MPVCEELGIGVVAYSPLGRGFLTGAIRRIEDLDAGDFRRDNPRFSGDNCRLGSNRRAQDAGDKSV